MHFVIFEYHLLISRDFPVILPISMVKCKVV